jgi:hypothetical protein
MKRAMLAVLIAGTLIAPVQAQEDGDAPEQGVARLSLVNGDVNVRRGDSGELVAAEVNAPLVTLDHVITGPGSRAEVQFDWANMIRLAPATEIRLAELEDRSYLVQIASGTATFRVVRDSSALVEISTPTVSVRPVEKGTYRLMVRPDGATQVTVRDGRAEIFSPRGSETLREGRTLEARGTSSDPAYTISSDIPRDDWDRWNENRDRDLERSDAYRYVSRDIYGADDLYGYGRWVYDSPYGWVWVPNVATGWAPYRVGRWVSIPYYGWSWLSADPWGWAPYHYGWWYSSPWGWAWYPGLIGPRYYWRPAIVGFFGWGTGSVSIGFGNYWGFGNVGWVPLAPYEVFRPWYGRAFRNTTIVNNVIVNNTNVMNVYRNARFVNGRNAVTSVRVTDFGRGLVNVNNFVQASNRDLNRAGQVRGSLPFQATPQSRRFSDRDPAFTPVNARTNGSPNFVTGPDRDSRGNVQTAPFGNSPAPVTNMPGPQQGNPGQLNAANPRPQVLGNAGGGWRRFDPQTDATPGNVLRQRGNGSVQQPAGPRSPARDRGGFVTVPRERNNSGGAADNRGNAPFVGPRANPGAGPRLPGVNPDGAGAVPRGGPAPNPSNPAGVFGRPGGGSPGGPAVRMGGGGAPRVNPGVGSPGGGAPRISPGGGSAGPRGVGGGIRGAGSGGSHGGGRGN